MSALQIATDLVRMLSLGLHHTVELHVDHLGTAVYVLEGQRRDMAPLIFVGTYTRSATREEIEEDIRAIARWPQSS